MIFEVSTVLDEDNLALLGSDDESAKRKLIQRLFMGLEDEEKEGLLAGFCVSDPRETFAALDTIDEVSWDSPTQGLVEVSFRGCSYYGCRDMDKEYEYNEGVAYKVDFIKKVILFSSDLPDLHERDTVEEF